MHSFKVSVGSPYEVKVGSSLLAQIGSEVRKVCVKAEKLFLVSDETVFASYGALVKSSLESEGFGVVDYVVPAGEDSKSMENFAKGLELMAQSGFKRSDAVVALGGGVVGDLAGFIAATYMRGVAVVQVPTTLLAMVDSSVGGKTAINLSVGKNMAGAFHEPALVVADINFLDTLSVENLKSGMGELLKYALLCGGELKELIAAGFNKDNAEDIIYLSAKYKASIVALDEKEGGLRKLLNLGHTFGHAYERLSKFTLSHGESVAKGLFDAIYISKTLGELTNAKAKEMEKIILGAGFMPAMGVNYSEVFDVMLSDKKNLSGGTIDFVVINDFGDCKVMPIKLETLKGCYSLCK